MLNVRNRESAESRMDASSDFRRQVFGHSGHLSTLSQFERPKSKLLALSQTVFIYIYSLYIKWYIYRLVKTSKNLNWLGKSFERPKSEQNRSVFGRFRKSNKIALKLRLTIQNPNQFGFRHSTVHTTLKKIGMGTI